MKPLITLLFYLSFYINIFSQKQIVVALDGSGDFKTIKEAIQAVPDNQSTRTRIFIKKGLYREKIIVPSSKINLEIIGEDKESTIISYDDYNPKVIGKDTINTWTSFTFSVEAEGFIARNLTFENTAGRVGQAVAVKVVVDQVIFINCRLLGNQDTLFAHGIGRMYFKDCYVEGTTDYIFGSAIALFDNCTIHSKANSYITAASTPNGNSFGFVFINCSLTSNTDIDHVYLGRPWRAFAKTVFIYCKMNAHIVPEGWHNWNDTLKERTVYYAEYKCNGVGSSVTKRVNWSRQLTPSEAETYTPEKIFARNSVPIPVVGSWNPVSLLNNLNKN